MLSLSRLQLLMELHSSPAALCCSLLQLRAPVLLLLQTSCSLQECRFMRCLHIAKVMPVSASRSSARRHKGLQHACSALDAGQALAAELACN